ncbi:TPA: hypothetical protein L5D85_002281 [Pseudomonas aeruginosa]|nr:hypothetical protein [Pseudomonas aeruginosa]
MPSPTPLYQIEECLDLYVDACMCDEQRNLVFLSTWGRDTVTQELLARLWAGKRVARQNFSGQTPKNLSFTPRARVGRDSRFTNTVITGDGFQSTRPCGARLWAIENPVGRIEVSIHAPVRGATSVDRRRAITGPVSIHAPVRGATSQQTYIF